MEKAILFGLHRFGALLAGLLLSVGVYAGDIQAENAWARATAPGQDAAGVDMSITSKRAAKLVGVSSPAAKTVEMHAMKHENGMMRMREVQAIELPAGKRVDLGKSGYHMMLSGLKAPLMAGSSFPLLLSIKTGNKPAVQVEVMVKVKPLTATEDDAQEEDHQHGH